MNRDLLSFITLMSLASCGFNGDVLRKFLPGEVANAEAIYNERDLLICAVSCLTSAPMGPNSRV